MVACILTLLGFGTLLEMPSATFFAFLLAVLLFVGVLQGRIALQGVSAGRNLYPAASEGEDVMVGMEVRNTSGRSLYMPLVADLFTPSERPSQCRLLVGLIPRGMSARGRYQVRCFRRRGTYTIGPLRVSVSDPLGLYEHERTVKGTRSTFRVIPGAPSFRYPLFAGRRDALNSRRRTSGRAGSSREYRGVRDYRRGDEPRNIHWSASARRDELKTKEFDQAAQPQTTLFLDLCDERRQGIGQTSTQEVLVHVCAGLARKGIEDGSWLQLIAPGRERTVLPFDRGMYHLRRVLDALVDVGQNADVALESVLEQYIDRIPYGSGCVLILGGVDVDRSALQSALETFRGRRITPLVVYLETSGFMRMRTWAPPESRHDRDRSELQTLLAEYGVPWYEIEAGDDLETTFSRAPETGSGRSGEASG